MIPTLQDAYAKDGFRFFNPCSATNSKGLVATSWRYSNRCYCQDRWLPLIHTYEGQSSFVYLSIGGHLDNARVLDTSAFGPADGYEDPRIGFLNDTTLLIIFVKFTKNPDTSDMCIGLVDIHDTSFSMTRTRMYTSTQRQKNWIPRILDANNVELFARVEAPQIVYHLNVNELVGHSSISVLPCALKSKWRGSSFFCDYKDYQIALVHERLMPHIKTRFMPSYEYAFCILREGRVTISEAFHLNDSKGFVYASGLQVINNKIRISAGITDCYADVLEGPQDMFTNLIDNKT